MPNSSSDPLRLLHITPYYSPAFAYGGTIRAAYELCKRLAGRGHDVTVYTTDALDAKHRATPREEVIDGVTVRRFRNVSNALAWNRLFVPMSMWRGLADVMRSYDVVHLHEFRSIPNAMALGGLRRHGLPYVITSQGGLPKELGRTSYKQIYDLMFGTKLLRGASRLHALTQMEADQYGGLGVEQERIVVLPNGIEVDAFDFEVDVAAFKREWDIPAGRPVVGFLARLSPIKAPEFLVDAFVEVLKAYPDAVLMLAGPDDGAQAAIEAQIDRLGIRGAVRFVGYIADDRTKAAAYRASDVYVLPSRYEIQGITPLEALLNCVPTIATDRCGLASYMADNDMAQIAVFGDVGMLAGQIIGVLREPERYKAQAERARRVVIENFDWEVIVDRWEDVYRACMQLSRSHVASGRNGKS
jgi:glycosyltransferase involved in cell wall biosynthesis